MSAIVPTQQKTPKKLIIICALIFAILLLFAVGAFTYFAQVQPCGSAANTKQALVLPSSFKQVKERRIECNNFVEGYSNKLQVVYDVSSATPEDFEKLNEAIIALGFRQTDPDKFSFARRNAAEVEAYSYINVQFDSKIPDNSSAVSSNSPSDFTQNEITYVTISFDIDSSPTD